MSNPHNLEVGQKLFRVTTENRSRHGDNEWWVTITKIGRRWAYITGRYGSGERVDMEDLTVDGGVYSSPARCYFSEEAYREKAEADDLMRSLRTQIEYRDSRGVKPDDIRTAAKLLRITLEST